MRQAATLRAVKPATVAASVAASLALAVGLANVAVAAATTAPPASAAEHASPTALPCPMASVSRPPIKPSPMPSHVSDRPIIGGEALGGPGLVVPPNAPPLPTVVSAKSWLVADLDSGAVLGACGAHEFGAP